MERTVTVLPGETPGLGDRGHPDLLGPDHTDTLARAQWRSARRLAVAVDDRFDQALAGGLAVRGDERGWVA